MNEVEVPPREAEYPQVARYLQRHPFIHFAVTFCYWFTAVTILEDLQAHFWQLWPTWSQASRYTFAFTMTLVFYISARLSRRFKAATGPSPVATSGSN